MSRERLALTSTLTRRNAATLARAVKALAEPSRLQLVSVLHVEDRWMGTAELRPVVAGLSESTVMHHLQVLETAGITRRKVIGGVAVHRLEPVTLAAVATVLRGGR